MLIYYREVPLQDGFRISDLSKNSRIVGGKEVSNCSGIALFNTLRDAPIKCWRCKCTADRWIVTRGPNDISRPVMNLFATGKKDRLVMMTRDHIIPKSLGGVDSIQNLRPGCEVCNGGRASKMNNADTQFMLRHPHLISAERLARASEARARAALKQKQDQERRIQILN